MSWDIGPYPELGIGQMVDTENSKASGQQSFVSHLECSLTGETFAHDKLWGLSPAGAPLLVRYDLDAAAAAVGKEDLLARPGDMWRLGELLPVPPEAERIELGEAITPLVTMPRAASKLGIGALVFKDEGKMPTGSFKARGLAMAVTMAKVFGVERLAIPTAGNAGAAAAAYGARAGMEVFVFMPDDTPELIVDKIAFHGAHGYQVNGLINRCGEMVREGTPKFNWHDLSTLAEPYRIEGKKTMGTELAEQVNWQLPDVIYYPTGGGTGFIGMWKAFKELQHLGWLGDKLPRMVAVQAVGCTPVIDAYERGLDHIPEPWHPVTTSVHGTRVPKPLGDRLIMSVIWESGGHASSASDEEADAAQLAIAREEGFAACQEGALCYAAMVKDIAAGRLSRDDSVVIFNTGMCMPPREGGQIKAFESIADISLT